MVAVSPMLTVSLGSMRKPKMSLTGLNVPQPMQGALLSHPESETAMSKAAEKSEGSRITDKALARKCADV